MDTLDTLLPLLSPKECPPPKLEYINSRSEHQHLPSSAPFADVPLSDAGAIRGWKVKFHVFPAAFPRSRPNSSLPAGSSSSTRLNDNKGINDNTNNPKANDFDVSPSPNEILNRTLDQLASTLINEPLTDISNPEHLDREPLWIAANHYIPPRHNPDGLTLTFTHGVSFFKESWEPVIAEFLADPNCPPIADIWCLDCAINGDSNVLNSDSFGNTYDSRDDARDYLQFILRYLPPANQRYNDDLPVQLPRQELSITELELLKKDCNTKLVQAQALPGASKVSWRGYKSIISIAHSMGCVCTTYSISKLPSIFSGCFMIDPMIIPPKLPVEDALTLFIQGTLQRSYSWNSIKDAVTSLKRRRSPYCRWRKDALDRFIYFGMMPNQSDNKKDAVRMKTEMKWEQMAYSDATYHMKLAFPHLKAIPSDVPVHFIVPESGSPIPPWSHKSCARQVRHSTLTTLKCKGHLLPMDYPKEVGAEIVSGLNKFVIGLSSFEKAKL